MSPENPKNPAGALWTYVEEMQKGMSGFGKLCVLSGAQLYYL